MASMHSSAMIEMPRLWLAAGLLTLSSLLPAVAQPQAAGAAAPSIAALDVIKPTKSCSDLLSADLSDIGGTGSRVTAARETSNKGVAACTVEGMLAPSTGFQVMLPTQTWTQRYLQVGCGGLCGRISLQVGAADGCVPLEAGGFVIGATDMGHQDQDGAFGSDPQKRADFAHRANHLTALTAKRLIQQFYGQPQAYAYFTGCSDGGREALVEAQRYPDDFDGIIAGAAAMNFQVQNGLYHAWQARSNTGSDGKAILVASRLPVLHEAVLKACDSLDGLADGLISNPLACRFDPGAILCSPGVQETTNCLTAAEVDVVRKLYDGPRDPATGKRLTAGGPQFGSELAWAGVYVPASSDKPIFSAMIALQALRNVVFETNPPATFSLADMNFDQAMFDRLRPLHALYDATNPDLSAFAASGGKLILWHGWADPHISPINTIAYYEAVETQMGKPRADSFTRLYLFPGMYHCSGGERPSLVDLLTPMLTWVEKGAAPDAVVARQPEKAAASEFGVPVGPRPGADGNGPGASAGQTATAGAVSNAPSQPAAIVRSRPIYAYPTVAAYGGQGEPNEASSFVRGSSAAFTRPDWAGADFYTPYRPRER